MLGLYSDATLKNAVQVMLSLRTDYLSNSVFTHISLSSQQNSSLLIVLLTTGNWLVKKYLVLTDLLITPIGALWCPQSRIHITLYRYCKGHSVTVCKIPRHIRAVGNEMADTIAYDVRGSGTPMQVGLRLDCN